MGDRAVVGHQRRAAALERVEHRVRQLGRAERRVGRHRHRPSEQQHLVVDAGQLVEHARQRGRHRRVRVHDRAGVVAAVDAEVQVELGGRRELAVDLPPVQVDDAHLLGLELGEHRAGGRDRHLVPARALTLPAVPSTSPSAASRRPAAATCSRTGVKRHRPDGNFAARCERRGPQPARAARSGGGRGRGRAARRGVPRGRGGQAPPAQAPGRRDAPTWS